MQRHQKSALSIQSSKMKIHFSKDQGPGIENIELALQDGYSTTNSLGLGLPGVRRLMDDFEIQSVLGKGTTVTTTKWLN